LRSSARDTWAPPRRSCWHMTALPMWCCSISPGACRKERRSISRRHVLFTVPLSRDTANSDVVVVTAGFPRKPGMSRDDLLVSNAKVVAGVMEETVKHSPDAVFIIVTNPMDVMAQLALQVSALDHWKIVGMGGVLDSARFRAFVAMELGVSAADVEALVMGGHGDTMVPMPRFTTVKGVPITELLAKGKIDGLVARTRQGGAEIVSLLKTGSAFYAPAAAISHMVKAVVRDEKRVLPCSAFLEGEYGVHEVFAGVPVILGAHGVERIIELELDEDERRDFEKSVSSVRTHFGMIA
jgi:malate dehydrogenase